MTHRDEVRPDPLNPNNGDVDEIMNSVEVNGCYRPIYAAKQTKHIVGGHNLYEALLRLGAHDLPIAWIDGDDEQARRILIGDNQIARLARMDNAQLLKLLDTIKDTDLGLAGTGFDDYSYADLIVAANPAHDGGWFPSRESGEEFLDQRTCPNCGHTWSD
jgi:ParB-like chromosome segregation protein Spo0J